MAGIVGVEPEPVEVDVVTAEIVESTDSAVGSCIEIEDVVGPVGGFGVVLVAACQSGLGGCVYMSQSNAVPELVQRHRFEVITTGRNVVGVEE